MEITFQIPYVNALWPSHDHKYYQITLFKHWHSNHHNIRMPSSSTAHIYYPKSLISSIGTHCQVPEASYFLQMTPPSSDYWHRPLQQRSSEYWYRSPFLPGQSPLTQSGALAIQRPSPTRTHWWNICPSIPQIPGSSRECQVPAPGRRQWIQNIESRSVCRWPWSLQYPPRALEAW